MSQKQQILSLLAGQQFDAARQLALDMDIENIGSVEDLARIAHQFRRANDPSSASRFSLQAARIRPQHAEAVLLAAKDLVRIGDVSRAEALIQQLPEAVKDSAGALMLRSAISYQRHQFTACIDLTAKVLRQHPNYAAAHLERAHALLMLGQWQEGWKEYQWRFRIKSSRHQLPQFRMPLWQGEAGLDHLLVVADQGYGDCFQFSRFLPMVAERCNRITLMRSAPLARLFDRCASVDASFDNWNQTPRTDAWCTLSDLPGLFSITPDSVPGCENILSPEAAEVSTWQQRFDQRGDRLRVGLAWSGRTEFENNHLRALSLASMSPLLDLDGVDLYSLQVGPPAAQATGTPVIDLSAQLNDFHTTAAAMQALDVIITTDTSVAHLAGTLGRPTCVLLAYAPDWRWDSEGTTSRWYTSMKLLRQDEQKDWHRPVMQARDLLATMLDSKNREDTIRSLFPGSERAAQ